MLEIISPVNGKEPENKPQTYLDSFLKGIKISLNIVETPYFIWIGYVSPEEDT